MLLFVAITKGPGSAGRGVDLADVVNPQASLAIEESLGASTGRSSGGKNANHHAIDRSSSESLIFREGESIVGSLTAEDSQHISRNGSDEANDVASNGDKSPNSKTATAVVREGHETVTHTPTVWSDLIRRFGENLSNAFGAHPCAKKNAKKNLAMRKKAESKGHARFDRKKADKFAVVEKAMELDDDKYADESDEEEEKIVEPFYLCNLNAFQANDNTRKFNFVTRDDGAWIDGWFTVDGQKVSITQYVKYARIDSNIIATSDDRVIYLATSEGCGRYPPALNSIVMGNNTDRLWSSFTAVARSFSYAKWNKQQQLNQVKAHFLRFYKKYATLDDEIMCLLNSERADRYLQAYFEERLDHYERRLDNKLREHCAQTGEELIGMIHQERMKAYAYNAAKVLLLIGSFFVLNFEYFFGVVGFVWCSGVEFRVPSALALKRKLANTIKPNYAIVPCSKKWINILKKTIDPERLNTQLFDGSSITSTYDVIEPENSKNTSIDVFGATIDVPQVYPEGTSQDIEAALRIRYAFDRDVDEDKLYDFLEFAKEIIDTQFPIFDVSEADPEAFLLGQYGQKRGQELIACREVAFENRLMEYGMFCKGELYANKLLDDYKPRMIFKCPDEVIAHFGAHFHRFSKLLGLFFNKDSNVFYTAGGTPDSVGQFGARMFDLPYVVESDVSNWDGSMLGEILQLEKYFISEKIIGMPEDIDYLLNYWGEVKGSVRGGEIKFTAAHGRRSGDLWTSSFNSLINVLITMWAFKITSLDDFMMLVMGDDNCVAMGVEPDLAQAEANYRSLGMKIEIIPRETVDSMTFCSGRFWNVNGVYRWGNLPFKVLSKLGVNHHKHSKKHYLGLLKGTCQGMLCSAGHVPVIGAFLRAIIDSSDDIKARKDNRHLNPHRIQGGVACMPSNETYAQFAALYGVDVCAVLEIEEWIECNVDINDCPYFITDSFFVNGFNTEFEDKESNTDALTDSDVSPITTEKLDKDEEYDSIVHIEPRNEEVEKLVGCKTIFDAIRSGFAFGDDEDEMLGTRSHAFLHALFSAISFFNLEWGVGIHSAYNHWAYTSGRHTCQKKKAKKKKAGGSGGGAGAKVGKGLKSLVKEGIKMGVKAALIAGGTAIGGVVGGPGGAAIGAKAGATFSKIIGSGDYSISKNSIMETGRMSFRGDARKVTIGHNDFVGNVYATSAFNVTTYSVNPGLYNTFPWCNQLARPFQVYVPHGIVFYYKPLSAAWNGVNQTLGDVIMGSQYNVLRPPFSGKREMLNYEFSDSCLPNQEMVHPIECDMKESPLSELYVRSGEVPEGENTRFYDFCNFQIATEGFDPSVEGEIIGELYVAYHFEFLKPSILPGGVIPGQFFRVSNLLCTAADSLGPIQRTPMGTLALSIGSSGVGFDRIVFPPEYSGGRYVVSVDWFDGGTTASSSLAGATFSNMTPTTGYFFDGQVDVFQTSATSCNRVTWESVLTIDGPSSTGSYIEFNFSNNPMNGLTPDVSVSVIVLPGDDTFV